MGRTELGVHRALRALSARRGRLSQRSDARGAAAVAVIKDPQYSDEFIDRLEALCDDGYLSPGGASEVEKILQGCDLEDESILDFGCGTGEVEVILIEDLDAAHVTAIDVEPQIIERTRERLAAGLADGVDVKLVVPGPLDFPDDSFDVVFSKD